MTLQKEDVITAKVLEVADKGPEVGIDKSDSEFKELAEKIELEKVDEVEINELKSELYQVKYNGELVDGILVQDGKKVDYNIGVDALNEYKSMFEDAKQ